MLLKFLPNFDEISFVILIESFKLSELNDIFINPSWLETFRLLDWRQDFGSSLNYGDIYYDFAKLLHGMIVSHDIVLKNQFEVIKEKNNIHSRIT